MKCRDIDLTSFLESYNKPIKIKPKAKFNIYIDNENINSRSFLNNILASQKSINKITIIGDGKKPNLDNYELFTTVNIIEHKFTGKIKNYSDFVLIHELFKDFAKDNNNTYYFIVSHDKIFNSLSKLQNVFVITDYDFICILTVINAITLPIVVSPNDCIKNAVFGLYRDTRENILYNNKYINLPNNELLNNKEIFSLVERILILRLYNLSYMQIRGLLYYTNSIFISEKIIKKLCLLNREFLGYNKTAKIKLNSYLTKNMISRLKEIKLPNNYYIFYI